MLFVFVVDIGCCGMLMVLFVPLVDEHVDVCVRYCVCLCLLLTLVVVVC